MKQKSNFSEQYKRKFKEFEESPPDEVWKNISNDLDVISVWSGIESELNEKEKRRKLFFLFRIAAVLVVLLSLPIFLVLYFNRTIPDSFNSNISYRHEKAIQINSEIYKTTSVILNSSDILSKSKQTNIQGLTPSSGSKRYGQFGNQMAYAALKGQKSQVNSANNCVDILNFDVTDLSVEFIENILVAQIHDSVSGFNNEDFISVDSSKTTEPINETLPVSKFKGFYAGGVFEANNNWLLNPLTFDATKNNSLSTAKLCVGYSYGFGVGYIFNTHWGSEFNWYMNSQHGQNYGLYSEGRYYERNIQLNYSVISLLAKHKKEKFSYYFNMPTSTNVLFGFNMGILKGGNSTAVSDKISITEDTKSSYSAINFSFRIGYGYDILLHKKWMVSPSIIGDIGLKDIYKSNSVLPGNVNNSHLANLGFNLCLRYKIK